jgi:hypothetical protein
MTHMRHMARLHTFTVGLGLFAPIVVTSACSRVEGVDFSLMNLTGQPLGPGEYAGHCDATFPGVAKHGWRHKLKAYFAIMQGAANHRVQDPVIRTGTEGAVHARFTYGPFDKDLEDEDVEVFIQSCPGWDDLGKLRTNGHGAIKFTVPAYLPPGDYRLRLVVLGDGSTADGEIAVWPAGVQAVVTDIDGTLTTSDFEAVEDILFGQDAEMYPDANTAMSLWVANNYRLIYLTGRPQLVNRYSRNWLAEHGFPWGVLHLTDSNDQIFPVDSSVGAFKTNYLQDLQDEFGVELVAAYGNASTDIGAYEDVGIAKERTFIIGPNAGDDGTQPLSGSYTDHLTTITAFPYAIQP